MVSKFFLMATLSLFWMNEPPKQAETAIFAYGSLLNKESAARTLSSHAIQTSQPAVAFGLKRIFDYDAAPINKRWGEPRRPNDTAMLNVIPTDDPSSMVNGVILKVDKRDLAKLIEREKGYDLVPVSVIRWDEVQQDHPQLQTAYTFMAREDHINPCINPVPGYAQASKEGAAQYGDDFLQFWLETTFLADGRTPFTTWEKNPAIDMCSTLST